MIFSYYLLTAFYVLICFVLLMVILLQQGKGDIGAMYGGGSSNSAFGARAGATVLSKATAILAVMFMLGAMALAIIGQRGPGSVVSGAPAPPAPARPAMPAPAGTTAPTTAPTTPAPAEPAAPAAPK